MNTTLLSPEERRKILQDWLDDDEHEDEKLDKAFCEKQDLRTKSILADEVRALIDKHIPHKKYLPFSADHTPEWDIYFEALQAVLKLIEAKEGLK